MSVLNISDHDAIRVIELNRPEKRNALNDELIEALKACLRETDANDSVRAVVIRGAGKDFCSGADLAAIQKIAAASYEENLDDARSLAELFLIIRGMQVPVIAAVHGRALAGGCGLATACDLTIATRSARFGYPEVKIGFVPAMVAAILRRSLGEKKSFEILTQGFEFSAEEAYKLGLVNGIFDDEMFEEAALGYASVYAKVSRSAVTLTKDLMYQIDTLPIAEAIERGVVTNARARMTEDCKAGIARFLNR
jgi:methylglutaconyl-CoA hydratase